jgi:hypothetical protein
MRRPDAMAAAGGSRLAAVASAGMTTIKKRTLFLTSSRTGAPQAGPIRDPRSDGRTPILNIWTAQGETTP